MIISMIQLIFEIPESASLKDKRRIVKSVIERLKNRYRMSAAEVDLLDSLSYAQIGGALVSNSKVHGESVLNKALKMIENDTALVIQDAKIHSEEF